MPDSLADHKDFMNARGARALADHINTYWRECGVAGIVAYPVQRPGSDEWDVRSNMIDGRVPKVARGTISREEAKRIAEHVRRNLNLGHRMRAQ